MTENAQKSYFSIFRKFRIEVFLDARGINGEESFKFFAEDEDGTIYIARLDKKRDDYTEGMEVEVADYRKADERQIKRYLNIIKPEKESTKIREKTEKRKILLEKFEKLLEFSKENTDKIKNIGRRRLEAVKLRIKEERPHYEIVKKINEWTIHRDIKDFIELEEEGFLEFLTGKPRVPGKQPISDSVKEMVKHLHETEKLSCRKISERLKEQGENISHAAVANIIKGYP